MIASISHSSIFSQLSWHPSVILEVSLWHLLTCPSSSISQMVSDGDMTLRQKSYDRSLYKTRTELSTSMSALIHYSLLLTGDVMWLFPCNFCFCTFTPWWVITCTVSPTIPLLLRLLLSAYFYWRSIIVKKFSLYGCSGCLAILDT